MNYQPVRGTVDLFSLEAEKDHYIVENARKQAICFGFSEIRTPIFESLDTFQRTLGEFSDVVNKEMYHFEDKSGNTLVLRPEGTAPVIRAILHAGLYQNMPQKFFYTGPMFRYERPQKGRLRQFHQIGVEYLGVSGVYAELDIILLAYFFLKSLHIKTTLFLNYLGNEEERVLYQEKLLSYLQNKNLSENSRRRLSQGNVLRILDSKDQQDQEIIKNAPKLYQSLQEKSLQYFQNLCSLLDNIGVQYCVNHFLVRGLDYYTGTVFEFASHELGAQSTILAGGRYDDLAFQMGKKNIPAVGWACGVERLRCLATISIAKHDIWAVLWLSEDDMLPAIELACTLRQHSLIVDLIEGMDLKRQLKKISRRANKIIIVGQKERKIGCWTVKYLDTGMQMQMTTSEILANVAPC